MLNKITYCLIVLMYLLQSEGKLVQMNETAKSNPLGSLILTTSNIWANSTPMAKIFEYGI
jgi:hypothetical protein